LIDRQFLHHLHIVEENFALVILPGDSMQTETQWYHYLAYFFGGLFLANTVPHLVSGMSGDPFQSPFADPPGKGLSSSTVNVLWGMFNLTVAYFMLVRVGRFELRRTSHAVVLGLAILLMGLLLAHSFGKLHGGAIAMEGAVDRGDQECVKNSSRLRVANTDQGVGTTFHFLF
jgi:hypothetical protein